MASLNDLFAKLDAGQRRELYNVLIEADIARQASGKRTPQQVFKQAYTQHRGPLRRMLFGLAKCQHTDVLLDVFYRELKEQEND